MKPPIDLGANPRHSGRHWPQALVPKWGVRFLPTWRTGLWTHCGPGRWAQALWGVRSAGIRLITCRLTADNLWRPTADNLWRPTADNLWRPTADNLQAYG